jgi:hypothetical protein
MDEKKTRNVKDNKEGTKEHIENEKKTRIQKETMGGLEVVRTKKGKSEKCQEQRKRQSNKTKTK